MAANSGHALLGMPGLVRLGMPGLVCPTLALPRFALASAQETEATGTTEQLQVPRHRPLRRYQHCVVGLAPLCSFSPSPQLIGCVGTNNCGDGGDSVHVFLQLLRTK